MKSKRQELIDAAWADYHRSPGDEAVRNKLIRLYLPVVETIAWKLNAHLAHLVEHEDLVQSGVFGLIDAIKKFDPARGIKFESFSLLRIRGSMLDEIRKRDITRSRRAMVKRFNAAMNKLRFRLGRTPTEEETAAEMGVELGELKEYARASVESATISLDAPHPMSFNGIDKPVSWADMIETADGDEERSAQLDEFMELADEYLDRREQLILRLYYFRNWSMDRIGGFIGLSESRISQMHDRIIIRLRSRLAALEGSFYQ